MTHADIQRLAALDRIAPSLKRAALRYLALRDEMRVTKQRIIAATRPKVENHD